jgi:hypothetical protein
MLPGDIAPHVSPVGTVSVSVTVPLKWLTDEMVMVDVAETPALTGEGVVVVIV